MTPILTDKAQPFIAARSTLRPWQLVVAALSFAYLVYYGGGFLLR
jgi:hypothetical protein